VISHRSNLQEELREGNKGSKGGGGGDSIPGVGRYFRRGVKTFEREKTWLEGKLGRGSTMEKEKGFQKMKGGGK